MVLLKLSKIKSPNRQKYVPINQKYSLNCYRYCICYQVLHNKLPQNLVAWNTNIYYMAISEGQPI